LNNIKKVTNKDKKIPIITASFIGKRGMNRSKSIPHNGALNKAPNE